MTIKHRIDILPIEIHTLILGKMAFKSVGKSIGKRPSILRTQTSLAAEKEENTSIRSIEQVSPIIRKRLEGEMEGFKKLKAVRGEGWKIKIVDHPVVDQDVVVMLRFISITQTEEISKFIKYLFNIMKRRGFEKNIQTLLSESKTLLPYATPEAIITILRTTYYFRDKFLSAWSSLRDGAIKEFEKRGANVKELFIGLNP